MKITLGLLVDTLGEESDSTATADAEHAVKQSISLRISFDIGIALFLLTIPLASAACTNDSSITLLVLRDNRK